MAFDLTMMRGGFNVPMDSPVVDYRRFYQMYEAMLGRSNALTQLAWITGMIGFFGTQLDTFSSFSKLDQHARRRVLEFGRCYMELHIWSFMALGPRPPEQWLIDSHLDGNFLRKPQREVDSIMMRSEFNHMSERGEDPALAAIALTALGLPSTPEALFLSHDRITARAVINFLRLFGSAHQTVANADDNELDYQNVSIAARFSAQSRHDATFMQFMDIQAWLAEAAFWHVSGSDLFNEITQLEVGSDALDATQAEVLEMFKLLRGIGETGGGDKRHLDLKKMTFFAELAGHGFVPSMHVLLFGLTEAVKIRDIVTGDVLPGIIRIRAQAPVVGSHPQRDTWVDNDIGQVFEMVVQVPVGHTPDSIQVVMDVLQPAAATRWFNFSGPTPVDADAFTIPNVLDVGGKTRHTFTATKAAGWAAGERVIGEFVLGHGPHIKASGPNGVPVEVISHEVLDGATDLSVNYEVVPARVLTGVQLPPTMTPLFAQRASGTLDN
jgi:hypothetical protein